MCVSGGGKPLVRTGSKSHHRTTVERPIIEASIALHGSRADIPRFLSLSFTFSSPYSWCTGSVALMTGSQVRDVSLSKVVLFNVFFLPVFRRLSMVSFAKNSFKWISLDPFTLLCSLSLLLAHRMTQYLNIRYILAQLVHKIVMSNWYKQLVNYVHKSWF